MYTVDTALESLKKYDIGEADLLEWEKSLGLDIAVDADGYKQYSPHHINLFKNVKKHLALGRTLDEIREIIVLPPLQQSLPQEVRALREEVMPVVDQEVPVVEKSAAPVETVMTPVSMSAPSPENAEMMSMNAAAASSAESLSSSGSAVPTTVAVAESPSSEATGTTPPLVSMGVPPSGSTDRPIPPSISTSEAPPQATQSKSNAYASIPKRPTVRMPASPANEVVHLVQQLTSEKDRLYAKLMETEKLNSHLYNANSLFHKKTNEMSRQISKLKESLNENERFKLLDDKARLHKQLLEAERLTQRRQDEIQARMRENLALREEIQQYKNRITLLSAAFNPEKFRGDWMEAGRLMSVIYDNFGINIESERMRLFRIAEVPTRCYGRMAVIHTNYRYETNNLWRRDETLSVAYTDEETLEGELTAEYILDGVPVAKALYRVTCRRHR